MMDADAIGKVVAGTIVLVFLLVIGQLMPAHVLAQESGEDQIREKAGPYEIWIVEKPSSRSVGQALFIISVLNVSTGQPVPDARVVVRVACSQRH